LLEELSFLAPSLFCAGAWGSLRCPSLGVSIDLQGWRVTMRLDDDLDILIERHEKTQQAFNRELAELAAQQLGNVGLAAADQTSRLDLFQAAFFQNCVDLEHKLRLDPMLLPLGTPSPLNTLPAPV
jgi:hypothetical protein